MARFNPETLKRRLNQAGAGAASKIGAQTQKTAAQFNKGTGVGARGGAAAAKTAGYARARNKIPSGGMRFNPDVKLDMSQIDDRRGQPPVADPYGEVDKVLRKKRSSKAVGQVVGAQAKNAALQRRSKRSF